MNNPAQAVAELYFTEPRLNARMIGERVGLSEAKVREILKERDLPVPVPGPRAKGMVRVEIALILKRNPRMRTADIASKVCATPQYVAQVRRELGKGVR